MKKTSDFGIIEKTESLKKVVLEAACFKYWKKRRFGGNGSHLVELLNEMQIWTK